MPLLLDQSAFSLPATRRANRWRLLAALAAVWTLCALLSAAQAVTRAPEGVVIPWGGLLVDRFADWYSCALFTPAYFWLARRYPVTGPHWARGAAVHLAATQLFVVLKYTLYVGIGLWVGYRTVHGSVVSEIGRVIFRNIVYENMAFWAVAGVVHAIEFHRDVQEREARAERLRTELVQARLDALTAQLHPHFLFNALNSVSSLMHHDVAAADAMLARLGDLLRRTLRAGERPEVTLREEFELLADYLAIVGVRFRDRLTVTLDLAAGTEDALVPHFLLQPLVENALEHGIGRRAGAGQVDVRSDRVGDTLVLSVSDDGAGVPPGASPPRGIGLANTRRRLAALHGDRQRLTLASRPTGGMVVRVELPFRAASGADLTAPMQGGALAALHAP
jgi:signal transduction histidine kinase